MLLVLSLRSRSFASGRVRPAASRPWLRSFHEQGDDRLLERPRDARRHSRGRPGRRNLHRARAISAAWSATSTRGGSRRSSPGCSPRSSTSGSSATRSSTSLRSSTPSRSSRARAGEDEDDGAGPDRRRRVPPSAAELDGRGRRPSAAAAAPAADGAAPTATAAAAISRGRDARSRPRAAPGRTSKTCSRKGRRCSCRWSRSRSARRARGSPPTSRCRAGSWSSCRPSITSACRARSSRARSAPACAASSGSSARQHGFTGGVIIRTAAAGRSEADIVSDLAYFHQIWTEIRQKMENRRAAGGALPGAEPGRQAAARPADRRIQAIRIDDEQEHRRVDGAGRADHAGAAAAREALHARTIRSSRSTASRPRSTRRCAARCG